MKRTVNLLLLIMAFVMLRGCKESVPTQPETSNDRDAVEVFPLMQNWTWTYDYQKRHIYRELGTMWWGTFDSGSVSITLLDSSKTSDTTISWSFLEEQHISHHYYDYHLGVPVLPGSLSSWDSSFVRVLTCDTRGRQLLTSDGLVWQFPIHDLNTLVRVFRFDDSTTSTLVATVFTGFDWIEDTLVFSAGKGLIRRHYVNQGGAHTSPRDSLRVVLKSIARSGFARQSTRVSSFHVGRNSPSPSIPAPIIGYLFSKPGEVSLDVHNILRQVGADVLEGHKHLIACELPLGASVYASGLSILLMPESRASEFRKMLHCARVGRLPN